jgi:hypothetical protein
MREVELLLSDTDLDAKLSDEGDSVKLSRDGKPLPLWDEVNDGAVLVVYAEGYRDGFAAASSLITALEEMRRRQEET